MTTLPELEEEEPKFEPRPAERRTCSQWYEFIKNSFYNFTGKQVTDHIEYGCPVCGEDADTDYPSDTMLSLTEPVPSFWCSAGYVWDEEHQCQNCGTVYEFSNESD